MLTERNENTNSKIIDWSDFEVAFGQHSDDFKIQEKELYLERFEDFVTKFNEYLEKEELNVDYSDEKVIFETMQKAIATYYDIRNEDKNKIKKTYELITDKRIYNFISFNYTKSLDNCVKILANKLKNDSKRDVGKCVHIHGYIDANMIMGVNDISQITNAELRKDEDVVSEIVKPQQNIDSRTGYENEIIPLINNSHIICIYGMSIGATDKKWWDLILNWLVNDDKRRLVILKYDAEYDIRFPNKQRKFTNNIVNLFLSYSKLSDEKKGLIKSRIYVAGNHNIFSMNLKKTDNIDIEKRIENLESEINKKISIDDNIIINGGTASGW